MSGYNEEIKAHRTPVSTTRREEVLKEAVEKCQSIAFGNPLLLVIDCDSDRAFDTVVSTLSWARDLLGVAEAWYTHSKSRGHTHVFVHLHEPMSQRERALVQGALGGDPKRAILDWRWAEQGGAGECFLIETNRKTHEIILTCDDQKGAY